MFDIKYELNYINEHQVNILRDGKVMETFDVITDLTMISKLLRQLAVLQGKLELTPELDKERHDILAWLMVHHN